MNVVLVGRLTLPGFVPINPANITISGELPAATEDEAFTATLTAAGGEEPYAWSITSGALPAGLSLTTINSSQATISGTPTEDGTFTFTVTATDASMEAGSRAYSLVVEAGAPAWSPADLGAGLALWLDASDATTVDLDLSNNVEEWRDKSGNGRHYTQGTAGSRPGVNTTAFPHDAFDFSGGKFLSNTTNPPTTGTTGTVMGCVFRRSSAGTHTIPLGSNAAATGYPYYWFSNDQHFADLGGTGNPNSNTNAGDTATGNFVVVTTRLSGTPNADKTIRKDGTPLALTGGMACASQPMQLVGRRQSQSTSDLLCEIILVIGDPLSQADWERIEGYLAHKWGTASKLPGGHPYKSAPP